MGWWRSLRRRPVAVLMTVLLALGAGAVVLARHAGGAGPHRKGKGGGVVAVQGVKAIRGNLTTTLQFVGRVASSYTVRVTPGVAGTVTGVDVAPGQTVGAGATLFALSNPAVALHAQVAAGSAQAASARLQQAEAGGVPAAVAQARAAVALAQAREKSLFQPNPAFVQRQQATVAQAEAQVSIAQQNLQALQSGQAPAAVALQNAEQAPGASASGAQTAASANLAAAEQALQQVQASDSPEGVAVANAQQTYNDALAQEQTVNGSTYGQAAASALAALTAAEADYTAAVQKAQQVVTAAQGQAQTSAASASAQVSAAQASYQFALSNAEHALQTAQANLAAQQAVLTGLTTDTVTPAAAAAAAAAVQGAQARLQIVRQPNTPASLAGFQAAAAAAAANSSLAALQAAKLRVVSPVAGTVIAMNPALSQVGASVGAGAVLATIQSDVLEAEGPIPQRDIRLVHPGQPAAIYSSASPRQAIAARVVGVSPTGNLANLTFLVTVAPDHPGGLAAGESASVQLLTQQIQGATLVPTEAVQTGSHGSFVYVLTPAAKGVAKGGAASAAGSRASSTSAGAGTQGTSKRGRTGKTGGATSTSGGHPSKKRRHPGQGVASGSGSTPTAASGGGKKRRPPTHSGSVRVVAVRTGVVSGSWTQVLSGLKAGAVVLVPGTGSYLATGDHVAVTLVRVPRPKPFPVSVTAGAVSGGVIATTASGASGTGPKAAAKGAKRGKKKGRKAGKGRGGRAGGKARGAKVGGRAGGGGLGLGGGGGAAGGGAAGGGAGRLGGGGAGGGLG